MTTRVFVASTAAEHETDEQPEIPWEITPPAGEIAIQLRTTVRRLSMGAGLGRQADLRRRVAALPQGLPVVVSPVAGSFIIGGDNWLGLCAIGVPPADTVFPLDWMVENLHRWFNLALQPTGVVTECGRIEGAWCPGFSDLAIAGRKVIGQGFRVTKECVVMRGVAAARAMTPSDLAALQAAHQLIGVAVKAEACTSISEVSEQPQLTTLGLISEWRKVEYLGRAIAQH